MSTEVVAKPGMHIGYDTITGVVPGRLVRLFKDADGRQHIEMECKGPVLSWHGQNPGGYKKGMRITAEADYCAPRKNFKMNAWIPVKWKEPDADET